MSMNMSFDDSTGSGTLGTAIANSAPVTDIYGISKGDLVLVNQNDLYLVLIDGIAFGSTASYITIGAIQESANFDSLINAGKFDEIRVLTAEAVSLARA